MHKPRGVIFDYGNTVLEEDYFDRLAGTRRLLEFIIGKINLTAEEIVVESDQLNSELDNSREVSCLEFTNLSFQKILYENLEITFSLSPAEMEREFWRAAARFKPAPGIHAVLDLLGTHGIATGIVSNCSFSAAVMMDDLIDHDVAHQFSFLISSADYGFRKPHPRIFQTALRKMGLAPQDVWFVGDNLDCDVKGAIDSGLFPVWYNSLDQINEKKYPCLEVKSWPDFITVIQTLAG